MDGPTDVGVILQRVLQKPQFKRGLDDQKIFAMWPEIIGEDLAKVVEIKALRNGVLFLHTASSSWKETVNWQKKAILEKANLLLATTEICEIRFV